MAVTRGRGTSGGGEDPSPQPSNQENTHDNRASTGRRGLGKRARSPDTWPPKQGGSRDPVVRDVLRSGGDAGGGNVASTPIGRRLRSAAERRPARAAHRHLLGGGGGDDELEDDVDSDEHVRAPEVSEAEEEEEEEEEQHSDDEEGQEEHGDDDDEEEGVEEEEEEERRPTRHNGREALRARNRRMLDIVGLSTGGGGSSGGGRVTRSRTRGGGNGVRRTPAQGGSRLRTDSERRYERRDRRKTQFLIHDMDDELGTGGSQRTAKRQRTQEGGFEEEDEEEAEEEEEEEEEEGQRKQYSLRDRTKVLRVPCMAANALLSEADRLRYQARGGGGGGSQRRDRRSGRERRGGAGSGGPSRWRQHGNGPGALRHYPLHGGRHGYGFGGGGGGGGWSDDSIPDEDPGAPANWKALAGPAWGAAAGGVAAPWQPLIVPADGKPPLNGPAGGANGPQQHNAEITPVQVDPSSVSFSDVGGLDQYVRALKEMVFLPLVYPELFERFRITPPRGVLFYGPPGTGKTLVARALAATASRAGRRVSFFMRKGADVLSKWVGESERQLRLLFEEAVRHQPSIIFFDEIDGLAPVRSSKQDQIHNSIVSTLLALMDGLDSRGKVVVIGATNRVDAVDGALRRPGRFDRELLFPLPNLEARRSILDIHTRSWAEQPQEELKQRLAKETVGYCGADIKALCTEASLHALRRNYPQIYESDEKLMVDPGRVRVRGEDFSAALSLITPASHRAAAAHARPLAPLVQPVLQPHLQQLLAHLQRILPAVTAAMHNAGDAAGGGMPGLGGGPSGGGAGPGPSLALPGASFVNRPRLLVCGDHGLGQSHLGPALLHAVEGLPVHAIGLTSLLSDVGARCPEEALVHSVAEARRNAPAVLYLPHLQLWWDTAPASLRATLWTLLADLPADLPLLLLATADTPPEGLDPEACALFGGVGGGGGGGGGTVVFAGYGGGGRQGGGYGGGSHHGLRVLSSARMAAEGGGAVGGGGVYVLGRPTAAARQALFRPLCERFALPPLPAGPRAEEKAPELPRAPEAERAEREAEAAAAARAERAAYEADQAALRALRMALREVATRLLCDRRWASFAEPVSPSEDPDYWDRVVQPMDLATLLARVDERRYSTPGSFLADVQRIVVATRQYLEGLEDRSAVKEISRAHALEDEARSLVSSRLAPELVELCEAIAAKGGPAPPPPGMVGEGVAGDQELDDHDHRRQHQPPPTRRGTRQQGPVEEGFAVGDPDAMARRMRQLTRQQQKQQRQERHDKEEQEEEEGGEQQQQQQHEEEGQQQQHGEEGQEEEEGKHDDAARAPREREEEEGKQGAAAGPSTGGGARPSPAGAEFPVGASGEDMEVDGQGPLETRRGSAAAHAGDAGGGEERARYSSPAGPSDTGTAGPPALKQLAQHGQPSGPPAQHARPQHAQQQVGRPSGRTPPAGGPCCSGREAAEPSARPGLSAAPDAVGQSGPDGTPRRAEPTAAAGLQAAATAAAMVRTAAAPQEAVQQPQQQVEEEEAAGRAQQDREAEAAAMQPPESGAITELGAMQPPPPRAEPRAEDLEASLRLCELLVSLTDGMALEELEALAAWLGRILAQHAGDTDRSHAFAAAADAVHEFAGGRAGDPGAGL